MKVGDKVKIKGKETEIISIAYDECGNEIYSIKGSVKDYYASDFEGDVE